MEKFVDIPLLNPSRFYLQDPVKLPAYGTMHFDNHRYRETVLDFEYFRDYFQKWQTSDIIFLQVISNFSPLQLEVYDCNDYLVPAFIFNGQAKATTLYNPGFDVYEFSVALDDLPEGVYYFKLKVGAAENQVIFHSEYFEVREQWENSILIEYTHDQNDFDMIFKRKNAQAEIEYFKTGFRVDAILTDFTPGSKSVVFEDQNQDLVVLNNHSFRTHQLVIGDRTGVPPYVADIINRIFGCSYVTLDGKPFARPENGKLEPIREKLYHMAGWTMELREATNKGSKRWTGDAAVNSSFSVVYNINTRAFGSQNQPASNNIVQIETTE